MEMRNGINRRIIRMEFPTNEEYVSVARMTVMAISNMIGFNVEEIDDIKLAVSEACSNAIKHSQKNIFQLNFEIGTDRLEIEVTDEGVGYVMKEPVVPDPREMKESGLGLFMIKAYMDDVEIESDVGKGTRICMTKFVEASK